MTILDEIVAHKRVQVAERKAARPLAMLLAEVRTAPPPRDFKAALTDPAHPSPRVIAEIKRRSPLKGALRPYLDPAKVARAYEQGGAAAISVLTDARYFGGSLDDLRAARMAVSLPVLCKEFIVDPYQLFEARGAGADAALLIAGALNERELRDYRRLSEELGMTALVEAHTLEELEIAMGSGAEIIGINNRDLHTLTVSLDTTRRLAPLIPPHIVKVAESGIRSRADCEAVRDLGVDAVLVGEALVMSENLERATSAMCGLGQPVTSREADYVSY